VAQEVEHCGNLGQSPGVAGEVHLAVPQGAAQQDEGDAARLIRSNVVFQLLDSPNVVQHKLHNVGVGAEVSVVRHFASFCFFLSDLRKENQKKIIAMQGQIYVIISYNFQLIDLWSINLGSWDLAADKSAIEIMKVRHKESMQMAN